MLSQNSWIQKHLFKMQLVCFEAQNKFCVYKYGEVVKSM